MAKPLRATNSIISLILVLCCGFQLACSQREPIAEPPEQPEERLNLIVISLDTLRADRLGCYGYERPTSPFMDSLAARGVRFATVIAESSWTLPSHMTLFTGLYPGSHGVTLEESMLPEGIDTLAETLGGAGYRTFAYTDGGYVDSRYGFGRGFETYDNTETSFAEKLSFGVNRIDSLNLDEAFFLFLHTYEIHCPYDPQPDYSSMFASASPEDRLDTRGKCGTTHYNDMELTPGQVRHLSDQYDATIRQVDDLLAVFVQHLARQGLLRTTVLVVLSDHGEEFKEHGLIGHERTLYIESLMVPLIILGPGLGPAVVEGGVGLIDVSPTIFDLLGVEGPEMEGRSLVPQISGAAGDPRRHLFSELDRHVSLRSVIEADRHLIYRPGSPAREMYDFVADPFEQDDLAPLEPEGSARLHRLARSHFSALRSPRTLTVDALSPEETERLRALGYID
jgi:arylsulfatase A-like enzyme